MNWLRLYHSLPYPLRVISASLRGYHLQSWRYGSETEAFAKQAIEREKWSQSEWLHWQEQQLGNLLNHASIHVPYYRQQIESLNSIHFLNTHLQSWPVLHKERLRADPRSFLVDSCHPKQMFHEHTSGTSGKPLNLWWSQETVRLWYALVEARIRGWNGVDRNDRWGILGGQLVVPFNQQRPPFWVWNAGLKQLYFSSYHMSPRNIPAYLDALYRHKLVYLLGYASSLYSFAKGILEAGLSVPKLKVVISNAEPLFAYQREVIAQAFQCPVRESYGMAEIVAAASECEYGYLHLWPEVGVIEVLADDSDQPVPIGQTGRLVCTGFLNRDMPLIRYETGDRGSLAKNEQCACGRNLPILLSVEGRIDDMIVTPDGRRIGRMDPVFKADLPIREAQIIQEDLHTIRVLVVPTADYQHSDGLSIVERVQQRVGKMKVDIVLVSDIPRSSNGKFRAVISKLTTTESR